MQEKVNKWLEQGCDYDSGIMLLSSTGKHNQLVKIITGRPRRYADKLRYELQKAAGLNSGPSKKLVVAVKVAPSGDFLPRLEKTSSKEKQVAEDQLPEEVEKAIKFHADAFKTRAILHEAMANLATGNTPELIARRKELSDQISDCSEIIEIMWQAKEDYYVNGTLPDIDALKAKTTAEEDPFELPDDADELKDLKKQYQSANSKDQLMLDYRQTKKGETKNPLPRGPKRTKLELRLKQREEMITIIDLRIAELS